MNHLEECSEKKQSKTHQSQIGSDEAQSYTCDIKKKHETLVNSSKTVFAMPRQKREFSVERTKGWTRFRMNSNYSRKTIAFSTKNFRKGLDDEKSM